MVQPGRDGDGHDRHDPRGIGEKLEQLGRRLDKARGRLPVARPADGGRGSAMGLAFRIATELVAGVLVGALIGWQLDRWFGTTPVMLLIFFVLGAAAGILNVVRVAKKMQPDADGNGPRDGQ